MNFYDPDWPEIQGRKRHQKKRARRQRVRRETLRPARGLVVDRVEVVAAGREGVRFDVCRN